jgi:hypothetical protein
MQIWIYTTQIVIGWTCKNNDNSSSRHSCQPMDSGDQISLKENNEIYHKISKRHKWSNTGLSSHPTHWGEPPKNLFGVYNYILYQSILTNIYRYQPFLESATILFWGSISSSGQIPGQSRPLDDYTQNRLVPAVKLFLFFTEPYTSDFGHKYGW